MSMSQFIFWGTSFLTEESVCRKNVMREIFD